MQKQSLAKQQFKYFNIFPSTLERLQGAETANARQRSKQITHLLLDHSNTART
jgi:hypothetical protein